jgi:hypothetical protein
MSSRRLTLGRLACAFFLVALVNATADARPAYKKALADYLGPFLTKKLEDCRTCHLRANPADALDESERPHNAFGARLKAVKKELAKKGQATDLETRLDAIADEDSDQDGVANLIELLAGRFPGEMDDRPTAEEIAEAQKKLPTFRKFRAAYPWRPFEVVKRPPAPHVENTAWVGNPVDAFIAAEHETRGLKPRAEANPHVLLRRVYLDLIGLPPTPVEIDAYVQDRSPDAYEKVVERLLQSPRYGERWGRHWMDVWRYSDVDGTGNQIYSQPHIWRWRDWIIESLNADKGYDRMILEMLAADELTPDDPKILAATGFLVRNHNQFYPQIFLQDLVENTSQSLLGVTLRCARCHDHMYDPILQKEYYQVAAVFKPLQVRIDHVPGEPDTKKAGLARVFDGNPKAETFLLARGDLGRPDKKPTPPGVPGALGGTLSPTAIKLPFSAYAPEKRDFVVKQVITASEAGIKLAEDKLTKAAKGDELLEADLQLAKVRHAALLATLQVEQIEDAGKKDSEEWKKAAGAAVQAQRQQAVLEARKSLLAARKELAEPKTKDAAGKKVEAAEKALAKAETDAKAPLTVAYTKRAVKTYPQESTGRRLAFARWLAHKDHPLTARVAVNHIWMRHFGQPIVPRVFDFGRSGPAPLHPALLDWLAAEFMERGWSMKALHRLLVTSRTYRMTSTPDDANLRLDPDNRYYWRMPSRRLEAEVVRDSLFWIAGKLDLTMGGPELDHMQGLTVPRRSLYFRHANDKQMELLKIFDAASPLECYQRTESIVPQQALALMNSDLTRSQAKLIAQTLAAKMGAEPERFIKAAFERVLCRPPSADETSVCTKFLGSKASERQREDLVHSLLNHYEFRTAR